VVQVNVVDPAISYKDADGLPDDLDGITLKEGLAGAAKLSLEGKGGSIPLPALGGLALPLTAQLHSGGSRGAPVR
jgi:hypothetical protein